MRPEVRVLLDPPTLRGHSSIGRAPALQAGGRRFESDWLHQLRLIHSLESTLKQTEHLGGSKIAPPKWFRSRTLKSWFRSLTRWDVTSVWGSPSCDRASDGVKAKLPNVSLRQVSEMNEVCLASRTRRRFGVIGSSEQAHTVDALAVSGDEGRGSLRKASGSRQQTLIRGCPNGETHSARSIRT